MKTWRLLYFIDSVFICSWWLLLIAHRLTRVSGKESADLVPQITLKSPCFQSLFHIGYETWIWRFCLFLCHLPLLTEWIYLAQAVFLQGTPFSVREFSVPLFFTLRDALIFTSQGVTWAHCQKSHGHEGFYYCKITSWERYGVTWKHFWSMRT